MTEKTEYQIVTYVDTLYNGFIDCIDKTEDEIISALNNVIDYDITVYNDDNEKEIASFLEYWRDEIIEKALKEIEIYKKEMREI